jgi:allophanate hydrolase
MASAGTVPVLPTLLEMRCNIRNLNSTSGSLAQHAFDAVSANATEPMFTSLRDRAAVIKEAEGVDVGLPLAGIPFAVKDNIDVAGLNTSAACPSFSHEVHEVSLLNLKLIR